MHRSKAHAVLVPTAQLSSGPRPAPSLPSLPGTARHRRTGAFLLPLCHHPSRQPDELARHNLNIVHDATVELPPFLLLLTLSNLALYPRAPLSPSNPGPIRTFPSLFLGRSFGMSARDLVGHSGSGRGHIHRRRRGHVFKRKIDYVTYALRTSIRPLVTSAPPCDRAVPSCAWLALWSLFAARPCCALSSSRPRASFELRQPRPRSSASGWHPRRHRRRPPRRCTSWSAVTGACVSRRDRTRREDAERTAG